jgi:hypothetical protein
MEIPQDRLVILGKFHSLRVEIEDECNPPTSENTPNTSDDVASSFVIQNDYLTCLHNERSTFQSRQNLSDALIDDQWSDAFVKDEILVVDYVTWFNCWNPDEFEESESTDSYYSSDEDLFNERPRIPSAIMQRTRTTVRHALLLTHLTLYLIEVQLKTDLCDSSRPQLSTVDSDDFVDLMKSRSSSYEERSTSSLERAKISALKIVCRLEPSDVLEITLPYRTIALPNGDEFAERSTDLVITTTEEIHFWLQFQSNEARGSMLDFLHVWYNQGTISKSVDLLVNQVNDEDILNVVELDVHLNTLSNEGRDSNRKGHVPCSVM